MEIVFYIQTNDHFPLTPYSFFLFMFVCNYVQLSFIIIFSCIMSDSWILLI
jgi:hypothetical protein